MNVTNINQKTTSDTRSFHPDFVLVGRGFFPTFQQIKLRKHWVHEGTHRHNQRKDTCAQPLTQDRHTAGDNPLSNGSHHP